MTISPEDKKRLIRTFVSDLKEKLVQDFLSDGYSIEEDFEGHPYHTVFEIIDEQKKAALETSEEEPKRAATPEE